VYRALRSWKEMLWRSIGHATLYPISDHKGILTWYVLKYALKSEETSSEAEWFLWPDSPR
jgi:hypothetical protein